MYYIVYGFIYLLSLLPMRVLYVFADLVYGLLYYVFGYRKKVVLQNLSIAFPKKTEQERITIAKKFYHNFVDTFIETIKLFSASKKFLLERFTGDVTELNKLHAEGVRCQVHLGHNFNWELGNLTMQIMTNYQLIGVYMPLQNKVFERLMIKLRGKYGTGLLPATNMKEAMMPWRDKQYMLGLVADQVPGNLKRAYWLYFFGKPTPFVQGPEKGARAGNIPVIFANIHKLKRGYYEVDFTLASKNPALLEPGELTRMYRDYLEEAIHKYPDMWLWSHRRWKREWNSEYIDKWIDIVPPPETK